jgi:hypothetical protein
MSDFTKAYQGMIKVHGWNGTAATLDMKRASLEARVYELNGHGMRVPLAMMIQAYSGTTLFAEAVAAASGGVFIQLPDAGPLDGHDLMAKFHELYAEIGELSSTYTAAIADGEIDKRERAELEHIEQSMHKTMAELMGTMFRVYCRPPAVLPATAT